MMFLVRGWIVIALDFLFLESGGPHKDVAEERD